MRIFGVDARVLIDTESNFSYVRALFAHQISKSLLPLDEKIMVITPLGEHLNRDSVYHGCEVMIGDAVLEADLIPLEMTDIDAILGMDWLHKNNTVIHCTQGTLSFIEPQGNQALVQEG